MSNDPYKSITFGNSLSVRVDGAIGAMSLSPNGRDVVLAGRRGLFIIDLDDPFTTPRWLHHITSWEVADVQWSPHHHIKPSWCISTSNQKALLWDLARPSNNAIANVLHKHTRAITDINFHPLDPEILATCSIDTYVYSWDMRTPRRPVGKWAEWRAGANQVKWNHGNPYQVASSHDHGFYIWDTRHGAVPVLRVDHAHKGKINGLDFGGSGDRILSCSNDKTVKLWNLRDPMFQSSRPSVVLKTDFPIARARHLPFGSDKSCGIMPVRGGGDAIHIVNYQNLLEEATKMDKTRQATATPVYAFSGHQGCIKDFLWRTQHQNYEGFDNKHPWEDYQLVTWSSQDFDLKLWPHDDALYKSVNYNPLHQKILSSLVHTSYSSDNEDRSRSQSPIDSPGHETPVKQKEPSYNYDTYCIEPPFSIKYLTNQNTADTLSALTYFKLKEAHDSFANQSELNHLNWISGVRMGRSGAGRSPQADASGPNNLGEEVSLVGHKFPKIRFERISVSTGFLVISLKGPRPQTTNLTKPDQNSGEQQKVRGLADEIVSAKGRTSQQLGTSRHTSASNPQPSASQLQQKENAQSVSGANDDQLESAGTSNNTALQKDSINPSHEQSVDLNLIFIRLKISFPASYPFLEDHQSKSTRKLKKSDITFDVEETHELTAEVKKTMITGLEEIAYFYSNKFNRFCLEPCLRFLLGDRIDLDDALIAEKEKNEADGLDPDTMSIEIGDESWVDDLITQHEAARKPQLLRDAGTDDNDEEDADLIPVIDENITLGNDGSESDDDLEAAQGIEPAEVKHDTTPLPKGCGAIWARNGQLVCFFLTKHNESIMRQSQLRPNGLEPDKRLYTNVSNTDDYDGPLDVSDTNSSGGDDDDDDDDGSVLSHSSIESFSDDWDNLLESDMPCRTRIPGIFRDDVRMSRNIKAFRTSKSGQPLSSGGLKSSAFGEHSLKNLRRKKSGKPTKNIVSTHDFLHLVPDKLALAKGYRVLGDTPEKLALHNSEVAQRCGFSELSHVWKIISMILQKNILFEDLMDIQSGFLLSKEIPEHNHFFWEHHPFGHLWLIRMIFDYFEKRNNIQMLAMLSCILNENTMNMKGPLLHNDYKIPIHTPYSIPPTPPDPANLSMGRLNSLVGSGSFDDVSFGHKPLGCGANPPSRKFSTRSFAFVDSERRRDASVSNINLHRGSLQSPLSAHMTEFPNFESQSLKNSRLPNNFSKYVRASTAQKRQPKLLAQKRSGQLSGGLTTEKAIRGPPTITVTMKNTTSLDVFDEVYSQPLLSDIDQEKLLQYREQYADLLFIWGLPYNRVKVLKFNFSGQPSDENDERFEIHKCSIGRRSRKALSSSQQLICPITDIETAKDNRWNSKLRNKIQYCGLCNLQVSKRFVGCTNCEHLLHSDCAADWWLAGDGDSESEECPTGCGCHCMSHLS